MEHLSNDREDRPNQYKNSHKLCDKKSHPLLSLTESQWKLRQRNQNFSMKEKKLENKHKHQEIQKNRTVSHSLGSE